LRTAKFTVLRDERRKSNSGGRYADRTTKRKGEKRPWVWNNQPGGRNHVSRKKKSGRKRTGERNEGYRNEFLNCAGGQVRLRATKLQRNARGRKLRHQRTPVVLEENQGISIRAKKKPTGNRGNKHKKKKSNRGASQNSTNWAGKDTSVAHGIQWVQGQHKNGNTPVGNNCGLQSQRKNK